jgi:anti-sigma regulatory factor (Ser/Thr protein kinase)
MFSTPANAARDQRSAIAIAREYRRTFSSTDRSVIDAAVNFATERMREQRVDKDSIGALTLALVEAVGNVIRHAAGSALEFTVEVGLRQSTAFVSVIDHGPGFQMRPCAMPPALAERGRGVPLMQRLCDSVEYRQANGGNRLILKKRLKAREPGYSASQMRTGQK